MSYRLWEERARVLFWSPETLGCSEKPGPDDKHANSQTVQSLQREGFHPGYLIPPCPNVAVLAGEALKQIQRNWAPYQFTLFRRAALIQEKLPYINLKPRNFPYSVPQTEIGAWTLIDEHTMIASAKTSSFLPCGKIQFNEDHENPPSRAYLKIQEALVHFQSFFGDFPQKGQHCFEAGACPGGWTYVLVQLGCSVFAVDRSELAESLMKSSIRRTELHA